jgi:leucyl/phenylalanyl-tRNA--protein transferase
MTIDPRIPAALLAAYRDAIFPMADPETGNVEWFSPDPRAIMPLAPESSRGVGDGFHISRSLARRIRRRDFLVTSDTAFEQVVRGCAEPRPGREETWIDERIVAWYTALHTLGHAHSIETYLPNPHHAPPVLVGGVYGVSIGGAFFAESMFSRPELGGTDASKVSLAHLVAHLRARGYTLMDVQLRNPHINQFGVRTVRRAAYRRMLRDAVDLPVTWGVFDPEHAVLSAK